MSYILEALKKAEKQRELGQIPGIESGEPVVPGGPKHRWALMLSLIVGLNLLVLLFVFWMRGDTDTDRQLSDANTAEHRVPDATTALPASAKKPAPSTEVIARTPVPVTPPIVIAPVAVVPTQPLKPLPAAAAVVPVKPAKIKKPVQSTVASTSPASTETVSLPVWPQIPDHLYQQINKNLTLDVHVFDEKNENRFVLINMRKYYEGDQLQEGPLLDEITQSGINLSFRGERFRVEAK